MSQYVQSVGALSINSLSSKISSSLKKFAFGDKITTENQKELSLSRKEPDQDVQNEEADLLEQKEMLLLLLRNEGLIEDEDRIRIVESADWGVRGEIYAAAGGVFDLTLNLKKQSISLRPHDGIWEKLLLSCKKVREVYAQTNILEYSKVSEHLVRLFISRNLIPENVKLYVGNFEDNVVYGLFKSETSEIHEFRVDLTTRSIEIHE